MNPDSVSVMPGQLVLTPPDAVSPKAGTVKSSVLNLLMAYPDGLCRKDFGDHGFYEVSNRIGELEADGWAIEKTRCERHNHRQRFTLYRL